MRKIFGIGETIYDILFKGGKPVAAVPGGPYSTDSFLWDVQVWIAPLSLR